MSLTRLIRDPLRVEVLPELGGRIHRLSVGGIDLLRTPGTVAEARADPFGWSGFVMAPWANRVPDARLRTRFGELDLSPNFADGSAIHGEVYARPWQRGEDGRMTIFGGTTGFPWRYRVTADVDATSTQLRYRLSLRNEDDTPMPAGLGWHPWFDADGGSLEISLDALRAYEQKDYLPVGDPLPVSGSGRDLTLRRAIPWGWHEVYTDPTTRQVSLVWPRRGISAELRFTDQADHVVVFASQEHDAIAIEPQTHAPDGHRRAVNGQSGGVATLDPGQELSIEYRLTVHAAANTDKADRNGS